MGGGSSVVEGREKGRSWVARYGINMAAQVAQMNGYTTKLVFLAR